MSESDSCESDCIPYTCFLSPFWSVPLKYVVLYQDRAVEVEWWQTGTIEVFQFPFYSLHLQQDSRLALFSFVC